MSEKRRCEDCIHHDPCERVYRYYFNMAIPDYKPKSCPCYKQNEVAREIFEEIEKLHLHITNEFDARRYAELKKKYTENTNDER